MGLSLVSKYYKNVPRLSQLCFWKLPYFLENRYMYWQSRYALREMCELFIVLVTCYDGCSATSSHDQIWKENNDMSKVLCNCDPEPITLDPPHQQIDLYQIANKGFVKSMTRYMLVKWANPCPSKVESWTRSWLHKKWNDHWMTRLEKERKHRTNIKIGK